MANYKFTQLSHNKLPNIKNKLIFKKFNVQITYLQNITQTISYSQQ
jgi:hypothetical protein